MAVDKFTKACELCGKLFTRPDRWKFEKARFCSKSCRGKTNTNKKTIEQMFWERVTKVAPAECWNWEGAPAEGGYGGLTVSRVRRSALRAHRVSWELHNGPVPDGLSVLHKCDNRKCVNPSHLFVGTQRDNVIDCLTKGRAKFGGREIGPDGLAIGPVTKTSLRRRRLRVKGAA